MIMNKGIAVGEKALEITLVRQQINAQAEALRYIHEARVVAPTSDSTDTWNRLVNEYDQPAASPYGVSGEDCIVPSDGGYDPFILNARTAEIWSSSPSPNAGPGSPPYSQVVYNATDPSVIDAAYGIWIESVPSVPVDPGVDKKFVDFHIRACWPAPGSAIPMTIGTIVRLYDPV